MPRQSWPVDPLHFKSSGACRTLGDGPSVHVASLEALMFDGSSWHSSGVVLKLQRNLKTPKDKVKGRQEQRSEDGKAKLVQMKT